MGKNVRGKVVVITGAARGIGAGLARDLSTKGAKVALVGLEVEELEKVAAECGPDAGAWEADVTSWSDLEKATSAIAERYGRIDVVVANAGIAATGFTRSIDPAAFERVINVDLLGVWKTVNASATSRNLSALAAHPNAPLLATGTATQARLSILSRLATPFIPWQCGIALSRHGCPS